ncbi:ParA family protein [Nocardia tengchongensis]|uniref:ParA family protein n=1 Tax=Nocardia tengchongensis TaxID=2055889 RepID=UPI0036C66F96
MTALLGRNRKAIDMSWIQDRKVISGVCDKGGVGKTTLISSLGAALAAAGFTVLIIDANKQGNVSQDLGIPQAVDEAGEPVFINEIPVFGDYGAGLARSIVNGEPLAPIAVPGRDNLYLCTGGPEFTRVKRTLASVGENQAPTLLAVSLRPVVDQFDYVLIDSPPEDEEMMKLVLASSRWVICPTKTDSSSILGLTTVSATYKVIREEYNPYVELLGSFIFGTLMQDDGKPLQERLDMHQQIMGDEGVACPHGVPFVERVAISIRDYGRPVTELEEKAIAERWPTQEINSITRVARAWLKVINFFRYELDCRVVGHRPGAVDRIELEIDENDNVIAITPVYAAHLIEAGEAESA